MGTLTLRARGMTDPYNPYTAPQAGLPLSDRPQGLSEPQDWTPREVIAAAWAPFSQHLQVLVGAVLLAELAAGGAGIITKWMMGQDTILHHTILHHHHRPLEEVFAASATLQTVPGRLAPVFVDSFFAAGLVRMFLEAVRGRTPEFATLFLGGDRFLPILALRLCIDVPGIAYSMAVAHLPTSAMWAASLGSVPLSIFARVWFDVAECYVVDKRLGAVGALRACASGTHGSLGRVFVLGMAQLGLIVAGFLACGVGALITIPWCSMSTVIVYAKVSGRGGTAPATSL